MKLSSIAAACALLLGALAAGPAGAESADAEALSFEIEPYTLDNGLTVILSRDDRLPVVAVEVRYLVGSGHERKGRSGFAHLFEHLMFQGSASFDDEYFKPFEPIGGSVNGTTNADRTNYYERVPSNYLELALWMESDRMKGLLPVLTLEKLDNQRDVVKNERRQRYENTPYGEVWKYLSHNLYPPTHPYGHTTIGSHEDLTAATLDDVKGFFNQYYVPANAVVTVVGDFDPLETKALIEAYFGDIPKGERAPAPEITPSELRGVVTIEETDDVKLPRVYLTWQTPAFLSAGDAAMDVLASVLSDGKSSRLYKPLVYEQKIAKDVVSFQVSNRLGSFFVIYATAAPDKSIEEVTEALKKTLADALATPPTEDEITRSVNAWRKSFFGRVEGVLSRAQLLSTYMHFVDRPDFLADDLARYTQQTPASVHAEAKKWLGDDHVEIVIRPEAPAAEAGGAQ